VLESVSGAPMRYRILISGGRQLQDGRREHMSRHLTGFLLAKSLALSGCIAFEECATHIHWGIAVETRPLPSPLPSIATAFGTVVEGSFTDLLRFYGVSRGNHPLTPAQARVCGEDELRASSLEGDRET
jgi:hypothetical protein